MILTVCALFFGVTAFSQNEEVKPTEGPMMELEMETLDYGTIEQNSEPLRVINFTNTGTEPLIIKSARGSCGCTVPIWPKEPIEPGASNVIEIRYDTKRLGPFSKTVKITTNVGTEPVVVKVKGKVLKPEDQDSVPAAAPGILSPK